MLKNDARLKIIHIGKRHCIHLEVNEKHIIVTDNNLNEYVPVINFNCGC